MVLVENSTDISKTTNYMSTIRQEIKIEISIYAAIITLLFAIVVSFYVSHTRTYSTPGTREMQWSTDSVRWGGWDIR